MSRRRVQLVILCEDRQHAAFVRRFVEASGWEKRQLDVILNPKGRGSGEQWVRERYANEVQKLRSAPHVARALVAVIDEDQGGAGRRDAQLAKALEDWGLPARKPKEAILHIVPARNIETWLEYLKGEAVDELKNYPKLAQERDCGPMVNTLKAMCDAGALREPAPPSLERASSIGSGCHEAARSFGKALWGTGASPDAGAGMVRLGRGRTLSRGRLER